MTNNPILQVDGVTKTFESNKRAVHALEAVSLTVTEGEFLCIIGESGCGKSTLLQMLCGFEKPSAGRIVYRGTEIVGPSAERSIVFQDRSLLPWLTVEQNLSLGLQIAGLPWDDKVREVIHLVGLEEFAKSYPEEISGGMAQRVAIGRALVSDARVLLLDEPFGALDMFSRIRMQLTLLKIWQERRMTIVFVTHDIDEAVFLGSRILAFKSKPGRMSMEVANDLAYPRDRESLEFFEMHRKVIEVLRSDGEGRRQAALDDF